MSVCACSCEERTQKDCENPLTLDECVAVFKLLRDEFYTEYKLYDLAALSIAIIFPLVSASIRMQMFLFTSPPPSPSPRSHRYICGEGGVLKLPCPAVCLTMCLVDFVQKMCHERYHLQPNSI